MGDEKLAFMKAKTSTEEAAGKLGLASTATSLWGPLIA